MDVNEENDLPLMSNTDAIRVKHYMLDLSFDFESQTVKGQSILFCQPLMNSEAESHFTFILDARHLITSKVEEVAHEPYEVHTILTDFKSRKNQDEMVKWFKKPTSSLSFQDEDWCLKIWKSTVKNPEEFPKVVKISWKTSKQAKSLLWRPDQLGHPAVFTPAAAVNNRSLFPCQEPPIAMASWQALVRVRQAQDYTVLCTGDQNATIDQEHQDHYFYTQMILPMSTFAVAIGKWTVLEVPLYSPPGHQYYEEEYGHCRDLHEPYPCHIQVGNFSPLLPTRLIGPEPLVQRAFQLWKDYIPACLESAYQLLGPHPFTKLDIVIVPRCYSGLGLASPSLMFISQSLLLGHDGGMDIRIAHEICHNWFGLLIGALDWTEEWLSEGFATFAEDFVHNGAMKKLGQNETKLEEVSGLRRLLRFQTLTDELESTPLEHQIIRPMGGQELRHSETQVRYVKNGQNPQMAYTQVHYLKGFFLLHHLCGSVGQKDFFRFLRHYIHDLYHGKLVHSTDFLSLFFQTFPDSNNTVQEQVEDICQHWLDTATLPASVEVANEPFKVSSLVKQVQEAVESWSQALSKTRRHRKRKFQPDPLPGGNLRSIKEFSPEQLLMFLELLIRSPSQLDYHLIIKHLKEQIGPLDDHCNADIQHRLGEMVVLTGGSSFSGSKDFLTQFLREHQAMGVYLYSEMASSKTKAVNKLAQKIFQDLCPELDPSNKHNISQLLSS